MTNLPADTSEPKRIVCVDQLRGYAVFGMLLVNAKGLFFKPILPSLEGTSWHGFYEDLLFQFSHHRTNFTYADTIAPLFLFVVGMGMRLSWLKRRDKTDSWQSRKSLIKRYVLLVLIGFTIYTGWLWDALTDIGLAGLLAVFLIDKKPQVRILAAFAFLIAYQCVFSFTSYGTWLVDGKFSPADPEYVPFLVRLIPLHEELFEVRLNGGLLGPMSWVMMLLFGSLAYDMLVSPNKRVFVGASLGLGVGLCAMGYAMHVAWGDAKAEWPITAYHMSAPFPLWATGLCFFQLVIFYFLCDVVRVAIPTFTSVGMNPLVLYIAQSLFLDVFDDFAPERLSVAAGVLAFAVFWGIFAGVAYWLHRKRIYIKL